MLGSSVRLNCPSAQIPSWSTSCHRQLSSSRKAKGFPTCFVIPIVTVNGKAFGSTFLHIGCFSTYSELPYSAQKHCQANHCNGYRDKTAAHVSQPDTCLTEHETYLVPPISWRMSPTACRQSYVSNIKPYGNHSREEYRRTVHFCVLLGKRQRALQLLLDLFRSCRILP